MICTMFIKSNYDGLSLRPTFAAKYQCQWMLHSSLPFQKEPTSFRGLRSETRYRNKRLLVMPYIIMLPTFLLTVMACLRIEMCSAAFAPHRYRNANTGRRETIILHARGNDGGRKIPKMPTLPVNTSNAPPEDTSMSSTSTPEEPNHYAASKPNAVSTMVVMDVENVRGAASFRISHEALLSRIRFWREDRLSMALKGKHSARTGETDGAAFLEPLIWICDHGASSSIHHFPLFSSDDDDGNCRGREVVMPHNFGAMFAGPGDRTADDVIVDLVGLRCGGNDDGAEATEFTQHETHSINSSRNTTIVITADARLVSRCQQARRRSSSLSDVIFVEPASLLQQLERYKINPTEEESLFGEEAVRLTMAPPVQSRGKLLEGKGRREDGKTSTMTSFKDSTIAMEQHAKFQERFRNRGKGSATSQDDKDPSDISANNPLEITSKDESNSDSEEGAAKLAAQLKTEQIRRQLLLSDAYYLARPSKNVRGRRAHVTSAAVHAKYKNRNISKKQQKKLYQKRFGKKRKEDMVHAAAKRKELAARLQMNLKRIANPVENGDSADDYGSGKDVLIARSMNLLKSLLNKFEEERMRASDAVFDTRFTRETATPILPGLDTSTTAGRIYNDKWDPLGSTLKVPLHEGENIGNGSSLLPPLRVCVISDTHGFEGSLARFADNSEEDGKKIQSDDFLLPQADLLLHCGDFAASGSRKTQRQAARRLDDFLARQTHISEKIVIQGNHDPDSPAKVLFPNSKALYVRSSSTLKVNGVRFTLEPYSRRMSYRSIRMTSTTSTSSLLPACDVLVSHEPPKGVLDLTYHGFSAGSMHLRDLVEKSEHKPRLWLCGHIHESRGVISKQFYSKTVSDEKAEEVKRQTMVINASNANSGRANRIVSGAIVVDIERNPSIAGDGDDTAENTIQSTKVDYLDSLEGNSASENGDTSLAGLGEDLELYVTRPGVRRRKGVPQSMRQQLKQARSTLISANPGSA